MSKVLMAYGRGTHANASNTNGGGFERNTARSWADSQGVNAGPIDTAIAGTIDSNGGLIRITSAGNFTNALIDIYAYCTFSATYTTGRYKITVRTDDAITIDLAWSTDIPTANVNVGGALADRHYAMLNVGLGDRIDIANDVVYTDTSGGGFMLECSVVITGATNFDLMKNNIKIRAVDSITGDLAAVGSEVKLNAGTANLGVKVLSYYQISGFEVYDTASGDAFDSTGGQDRIKYIRCVARDTGGNNDGITGDDTCAAIGCKSFNHGLYGIQFDNDGLAMACETYLNGNQGIDMDGAGRIYRNRSYNNGTGQIQLNYGYIQNNIVWNDISDSTFGIKVDEQNPFFSPVDGNVMNMKSRTGSIGFSAFVIVDPAVPPLITNNSFINCETAIVAGNDWNGKAIYESNSFYNNTTDRDANSDDYGEAVNDILTDPLFTDAANNDYTLQALSPLREQGFDWAVIAQSSTRISIGAYNAVNIPESGGGLLMANKRGNKQ